MSAQPGLRVFVLCVMGLILSRCAGRANVPPAIPPLTTPTPAAKVKVEFRATVNLRPL